jgi:hypothetical protein
MDKVCRSKKALLTTALTALLLAALPAHSGTVLFSPRQAIEEDATTGEQYPSSSFGQAAPTRTVTGTEADTYSATTTGAPTKNRAPAGLIVGDENEVKKRDLEYRERSRAQFRPEFEATSRSGMAAELDAEASHPGLGSVPTPTTESIAIRKKGVQEVSIIAADLGFFPKTVFVTRDIPVRLFVTGASKNSLCIMMDSFQVRKQVRSQKIEEITFTPGTPGRYRFYCPVNGMEGTLIVKELALN